MRHVAVIVPTLNEINTIDGLLSQILAEPVGFVLVADGGSSDGTQAVVERRATAEPRLRLIHNGQRFQSAGVNLAAAALRPEASVLVRLDAHASYPDAFLHNVVSALESTGADSVVTRLKTEGAGCFQRAVSAVCNSAFGTGGAAHRMGGASGWIDHGHHAAFQRASFERIGGYDPTFSANEDAEYDIRLQRDGGRIWFASELEIGYHPRRSASALARQYFRYGAGRARTFLKHGQKLRLRQMAAPSILVAVILGLLLAPLSPMALLIPAGYLVGIIAATLLLLARTREPCVAGAVVALPTIQLCWAVGFISTLLHGGITKRRGRDQPSLYPGRASGNARGSAD